MKIISKIISLFIILSLIIFSSCKSEDSFSTLQDKEDQIIRNYIQNNGIKVVNNMPELDQWDTSTYYLSSTGIYYHLVSQGDTTQQQMALRSKVSYRYIEHNLKAGTTISYWEPGILPTPFSIIYDPTSISSGNIATGILEALGYMKYQGTVAKVIVPSSQNTSAYSNYDVIPVVYDLKITNIQ